MAVLTYGAPDLSPEPPRALPRFGMTVRLDDLFQPMAAVNDCVEPARLSNSLIMTSL